jgi:hypothetical protein
VVLDGVLDVAGSSCFEVLPDCAIVDCDPGCA